MIISRTPLRISFVGGGSDLPVFYKKEAGAVVSTTINKYIYITVNKKFDDKIRVSYSKTEIVDKLDDLQHELIREALKTVGPDKGIEITSISDIPSKGTGLGSSSSYLVGLLHALYAYKGQDVDAERLAKEACKIEIDILKKPIGKQDQYIAAYGNLQFIQFNPDESVFLEPIACSPETKRQLEKRLLLFYTGITRSSALILTKHTQNLASKKEKWKMTSKTAGLAQKMRQVLTDNDLDTFGELLHQHWVWKREMAEGITSPQIDLWYYQARKAGAIGGKILGAGGGGFLLFYAPKSKHKKIIQSLPELLPVDFKFEPQGSKIIFSGS